jgi:hypothetical protein
VQIFLDRLFSGLTDGSIYALMALALVVVFRSSSTINFAQGEFALFTSFVAWWLNTKGVPLVVSLLVAMVVGFAMGVGTERFLIRPVRRRNETAVLIIGLGLFTALNGADGWIWGPSDKVFPEMLPSANSDGCGSPGGTRKSLLPGLLSVSPRPVDFRGPTFPCPGDLVGVWSGVVEGDSAGDRSQRGRFPRSGSSRAVRSGGGGGLAAKVAFDHRQTELFERVDQHLQALVAR